MPSISTLATGMPTSPVATSLAITTTSLDSCSPTAIKSPYLFSENCLGNEPPAGQSWWKVKLPLALSAKVERESEGIWVLLEGMGLGREKEVLLRFEIRRKRLSGYTLSQWCQSVFGFWSDEGV